MNDTNGSASVIASLIRQNAAFAANHFSPSLKIIPTRKLMIIGCVDPRVDPSRVLGIDDGDAAIIRNVGGRFTPSTLDTLTMLRVVAKAGGGELGRGWNLIVLHHTDCGITRLGQAPDLLARYFGVQDTGLGALAVNDPRASVAVDIEAMRSTQELASELIVSGMVYDVHSGLVEVVVPPASLRA